MSPTPPGEAGDAAPGATVRPDPATRLATWLVGGVVAALLFARLIEPDFVHLLWADRDLVRTLDVLAGAPPVAGAELNYGRGGRIPGGFQYLLLALPLAWSQSAAAAYRFVVVLDAVAVAGLGLLVGRRWGAFAGVVAAATFALSDSTTETLRQLWNPALVSLPAVATLAACVRVAETRDARWLSAAALAAALGAQCHLSVGLVGVALLVATLLTRPRGLLVHGTLAALLVLAAYGPYLWVEAAQGGPNGQLLATPVHRSDLDVLSTARPRDLRNLRGLLDLMGEHRGAMRLAHQLRLGGAETLGRVAGAGTLLALLLGVGSLSWRDGRDRALRTVLLAAVLVGTYFVMSHAVDVDETTQRYLVPWLPMVGVLAGVGAGRAVAWLGRRSRALAGVLALTLALALALRGAGAVGRLGFDDAGLQVATARSRALEAAVDALGTDLEDVAARTVVLRQTASDADGWFASPVDGVAFELRLADRRFPGSRIGTCLALLPDSPRLRDDPAAVQAAITSALGAWAGMPTIVGLDLVDGRHVLARYALDADEPCRTTLTNRYVLQPAEALALRLELELAPDEVRPLPPPPGSDLRVVVAVPVPVPDGRDGPVDRWLGTMPAIVDVTASPGRVRATLQANQLRGHAYNDRFFLDAMVERPALELVDPDGGVVTLPFAPGLVGQWGALVPLTAEVAVPAGRWRLRLVGDRLRDVRASDWPPDALHRLPYARDLPGEVVVPSP